MTETETKWAERVREWRASDQTLEEFARGREYRPSTIRYWASELRKTQTRRDAASAVSAVRIVPVKTVGAAQARVALTVVVGAARIEVGANFDRELLLDVVRVLGRTP